MGYWPVPIFGQSVWGWFNLVDQPTAKNCVANVEVEAFVTHSSLWIVYAFIKAKLGPCGQFTHEQYDVYEALKLDNWIAGTNVSDAQSSTSAHEDFVDINEFEMVPVVICNICACYFSPFLLETKRK